MENNALWHERDISHSSVERVILPDSCILLHYMLGKTISLMENLLVYPDNMLRNIEITNGLVFSQALLLHLTQTGMSRENAYALVQRHAMTCWKTGQAFLELVLADAEINTVLSEQQIRAIFDYDRYLRHVDYILRRCNIVA
jgi:adenylosuccinate lyase